MKQFPSISNVTQLLISLLMHSPLFRTKDHWKSQIYGMLLEEHFKTPSKQLWVSLISSNR